MFVMCISAPCMPPLSDISSFKICNSDFLEEAFTFSEFKCCLQNGFLTLEKYFLDIFSGIRVVTPKLLGENFRIALIFQIAQITNQAVKLKKPAGISTKVLQHKNSSEKQCFFNKAALKNQTMSQQNIARSPRSLAWLGLSLRQSRVCSSWLSSL